MFSAQSDTTNALPSPTYTHVDAGFDVPLRPSSPASFLQKSLPCVRLSLSLSGETDTGLDTARDDGKKGDNADVRRNGAQFARPVTLHLK